MNCVLELLKVLWASFVASKEQQRMSPQGVKCMCYMKHKLLKVGGNLTTSKSSFKKNLQ